MEVGELHDCTHQLRREHFSGKFSFVSIDNGIWNVVGRMQRDLNAPHAFATLLQTSLHTLQRMVDDVKHWLVFGYSMPGISRTFAGSKSLASHRHCIRESGF